MAGSLRTPLGRVRGLGAAKSGTADFIAQRVSAVALAVLASWFAISVALHLDGSFRSARLWLSEPLNAILMIFLTLATFYHMGAGMRVIIEDYIHRKPSKMILLLANMFLWIGLALASLYAILKVSFGS